MPENIQAKLTMLLTMVLHNPVNHIINIHYDKIQQIIQG